MLKVTLIVVLIATLAAPLEGEVETTEGTMTTS